MCLSEPRFETYISTLLIFMIIGCQSEDGTKNQNWSAYLGNPHSTQYSGLRQIDKSNVHELQEAWRFDTGDSAMYQANNLVIGGIVYTPAPSRRVLAIDGSNGQLIWEFDPRTVHDSVYGRDQRGLMYWAGDQSAQIFTVNGPWMYALQAQNGELVNTFGEGGFIHLGEQLDVEGRPNVTLNTPGYIYRDLIIMGTQVGEDIPGAIRAFDVRTGKRKWIFHTLPRPGEFGSETWPEGYLAKTGGASDWSGIAIDTMRGIVYSSTETAGPDFYGGDRFGENLFANSLIALNAETGMRLWHHQLVHHDLWDLDCPTPPTLLTVRHEGTSRDVVAQGTKMGYLFVFDRETGEPLWPIEERAVPQSKIPDIKVWPTQPFPTKPPPLTRQLYTEAEISNISPRAELQGKEMLAKLGSYGSFPPPSLEQTIIFPGYDGGMEWGGSAADRNGILYVNVNEIPWFYQLIPTRSPDGKKLPLGEKQYLTKCASCHGVNRKGNVAGGFPSLEKVASRLDRQVVNTFIENGGGRMPAFKHLSKTRKDAIVDYLFGVEPNNEDVAEDDTPPYAFMGFERWFDEEGYPAIKPPWGTLNAVDLNTGTIKWKVPLGEYQALSERGIPPTGTENYGGPIVTASGLIFIGASADNKFRAFDAETGEILWHYDLPFDGNSTPSTYSIDGKQFVIISAGGAKTNRPKGGVLMAFSL